jgi:hypothetical protein
MKSTTAATVDSSAPDERRAGYARIGRLRPLEPRGPEPPQHLAAVLKGLFESDIASQAHIGSRIDLWIGEAGTGPSARASFGIAESRSAARWLHRSAVRLFPASRYARRHSGRFHPVAILARMWRPF